MNVSLPLLYLPPIGYYVYLLGKDEPKFNLIENFKKKTFHNRCEILSSGGIQNLIVPVLHNGFKTMAEVEISYAEPWVLGHQKSLNSAYRSSAFFEHYKDELFAILDTKPKKLHQLNLELHRWLWKSLEMDSIFLSPEVLKQTQLNPNWLEVKSARENNFPKYFQVFFDKFEFIANLSALDLLFNLGPESILYLKKTSELQL
ncbi:MAG: hypothetical protein C4K58_03190 [Flavobacteriaceae bacterium]|nr:MAG: hypothetical protein C4K58_03190 [Flavobacteriaceae bacterium]